MTSQEEKQLHDERMVMEAAKIYGGLREQAYKDILGKFVIDTNLFKADIHVVISPTSGEKECICRYKFNSVEKEFRFALPRDVMSGEGFISMTKDELKKQFLVELSGVMASDVFSSVAVQTLFFRR